MSVKDSKGRKLQPKESQLADGRYRYRWTDASGKRQTVYAWKLVPTDRTPSGKKEDLSLREKIRQIERDIADGIDSSRGEYTVNQLIQLYFSTLNSITNTTRDQYISSWTRYVKDSFLGSKKISKVRKSDILRFYNELVQERGLKLSTLGTVQVFLHPAFQLAVDDSLIRVNPCAGSLKALRGSSNAVESVPYVLTLTQQVALLDFLRKRSDLYLQYVLCSFLLGTGCRIGEALGITWNDIDFENGLVSVSRQLQYRRNGEIDYHFFISQTKTHQVRAIPLQEDLKQLLRDHKLFWDKLSGKKVEIDGYSDFIFLDKNLSPLKTRDMPYFMNHIRDLYTKEQNRCVQLGYIDSYVSIERLTPHMLRHTYCTRMSELGLNIKTLQYIMGHATIDVTMQIYNHVDNTRTLGDVRNLPSVLNGKDFQR